MRTTTLKGWMPVVLGILAAAPAALGAQKVELLYTKAATEQALDYKARLKVSGAVATNALSLMNISPERQKAYLAGLAGVDAVIVFGDGAIKAVSAIPYPVPVIVVGATGTLAAKGPVLHVMGPAAAAGTAVGDAASFALPAGANAGGKVTVLKVADASAPALVDRLVHLLSGK